MWTFYFFGFFCFLFFRADFDFPQKSLGEMPSSHFLICLVFCFLLEKLRRFSPELFFENYGKKQNCSKLSNGIKLIISTTIIIIVFIFVVFYYFFTPKNKKKLCVQLVVPTLSNGICFLTMLLEIFYMKNSIWFPALFLNGLWFLARRLLVVNKP